MSSTSKVIFYPDYKSTTPTSNTFFPLSTQNESTQLSSGFPPESVFQGIFPNHSYGQIYPSPNNLAISCEQIKGDEREKIEPFMEIYHPQRSDLSINRESSFNSLQRSWRHGVYRDPYQYGDASNPNINQAVFMPRQQDPNPPGYGHLLRNSSVPEQHIGISPNSLQQSLQWQQVEEEQSATKSLWQYRSKSAPDGFEQYPQYYPQDINSSHQVSYLTRQPLMREQDLRLSKSDVDETSMKAPGKSTKASIARKRSSGKPNVARACSNCKRAHLGCDESRPCQRCLGLGKQDTC
ncbi:hypothetical protein HK096_009813, partial [Nowakowskiella sp. JEL0078]